jgi:hypothetical protein
MRTLRNFTVGLLAVIALACAKGGAETDVDPDAPTTLLVDNQAFNDMTIYAIEGARRVRLGIAGGLSQTRFTIPKYLVRSISTLRFQGDPIGGNRTPFSDEIQVTPGDQVVLRIPPA